MSQKEHEGKGRHSLEVRMSQETSLGCATLQGSVRLCKAVQEKRKRSEP